METEDLDGGEHDPDLQEGESGKAEAGYEGHDQHEGERYLGVEAVGSLVKYLRRYVPWRLEDKAAESKVPGTFPGHFSEDSWFSHHHIPGKVNMRVDRLGIPAVRYQNKSDIFTLR